MFGFLSPEWVFVYCPRSGERVFADGGACPVHRHPNGSRHAWGTHLHIRAADSGSWWRGAAKDGAKEICRQTGGIAWDERGEIHVLVPEGTHVDRVCRTMARFRAAATGDIDALGGVLSESRIPSWDGTLAPTPVVTGNPFTGKAKLVVAGAPDQEFPVSWARGKFSLRDETLGSHALLEEFQTEEETVEIQRLGKTPRWVGIITHRATGQSVTLDLNKVHQGFKVPWLDYDEDES